MGRKLGSPVVDSNLQTPNDRTQALCATILLYALDMQSAFAQGGWFGSTVFTLTIAAVSYVSSRALVRCAAHTGAETEASVGGFTVGPWFEFVGNVSLVVRPLPRTSSREVPDQQWHLYVYS